MVPEADERKSKEEAKCSTKLSNLALSIGYINKREMLKTRMSIDKMNQ